MRIEALRTSMTSNMAFARGFENTAHNPNAVSPNPPTDRERHMRGHSLTQLNSPFYSAY